MLIIIIIIIIIIILQRLTEYIECKRRNSSPTQSFTVKLRQHKLAPAEQLTRQKKCWHIPWFFLSGYCCVGVDLCCLSLIVTLWVEKLFVRSFIIGDCYWLPWSKILRLVRLSPVGRTLGAIIFFRRGSQIYKKLASIKLRPPYFGNKNFMTPPSPIHLTP